MSLQDELQNELSPDEALAFHALRLEQQKPEPEEPPRRPRIISLWEAANHVKQPDWLVYKHAELNTLSGLFAPPSNCKSLAAIDLACCVATGRDWHGYRVSQGGVVYIAGEGSAGLKKRTRAWKIRHNSHEQQIPLYLCEHSVNGQSVTDILAVCLDVEQLHDIQATPIRLVVVDTVARNFGAGDENSARDMGSFIQHMDTIRNRWRCHVLLLHHTGHNERDRARGSSAFKAALDAEYVIRKDERLVELKNTKMKDADEPDAIQFELHSVDLGILDDDGQPVNSAVLDLTDKAMPAPAEPPKRPRLSANYQAALHILEGIYKEYRENLSRHDKNPDKALVETVHWRQRCIDADITTSKHWSRIPKTLEEKGFILRRDMHTFLIDD
ncbi:helicase RepA family protein [Endozoicomonas sp. ALD040]|uniref:helicase RepA family protein n=1 Tax=Endozoicomonas sp. ALD040 TaxID=3403079 RepID=UPI003BB1186B